MSEQRPTPESEPGWDPPISSLPQQAVAVFDGERAARDAVQALVAAGVRREAIRVGAERDRRAALRGEMREEADHTFAGPAGALPKEATRGAVAMALVGGGAGGVIGALISLIPFGGHWWVRLVILVTVGIAAGSTIGFIAGGGAMARGPAEPPAAARGITVAVQPVSSEVVEVLRNAAPLRVDMLTANGDTLGVVTTEADRRDADDRAGPVSQAGELLREDPTAQRSWATNGERSGDD
ncbi:MAG TPA: hypothetical protein VHA73_15835 [Acidimicrobiales bacterium]|jgi:hypothetical protein|nr:hypothetical protein [Acidimicrobiales bacterium]